MISDNHDAFHSDSEGIDQGRFYEKSQKVEDHLKPLHE